MQLQRFLSKAACLSFLILLPALALVGFTPPAQAQQTFSGPCSFTATVYQRDHTTKKIIKTSQSFGGTIAFYLDASGNPVQVSGSDGNFCLRFIDGSNTLIGIEELAGATSKVSGAKSDSLVAEGAGLYFDYSAGTPIPGPAYLIIAKGTLTPGGDSPPTSISVSGQVGGGIIGTGAVGGYVWSAKFSATLNPQ